MKYYVLYLLLLCSLGSFSQFKNDSSLVINGKKYCFHQLQKGETLFQLSRTYKIAYSIIKEANPDKGDVVNLGDYIKIPCEFTKVNVVKAENQKSASVSETEAVVKDQEPVKQINENLNDNSVFRLGLMLPFQFDKNQIHMSANIRDEIPEFLLETRVFLDFYEGMTIALDSLAKMGKNIVVYVYDSKVENTELLELIKKPEFSKLNMIIGPAYSSNFTYLSGLLKNQNTYLVSPFVKNKVIIENNPKAIKILPSMEGRANKIAKYLFESSEDENIVLVYENEKDKILLLKVLADFQILNKESTVKDLNIPVLAFGINETVNQLKAGKKNIVVSMNTDENFTMKLVSRLQGQKATFDIALFGMEEWKDFKNIEVNYWDELKIHIVGNLDYNYGYGLNQSFFKNYYNKFGAEPVDYAVLGYDVTFNLLKNLDNNQFELNQIVGKYFVGGKLDFQFKYGTGQNGIENKACGIYNYQNFKFIRVDD